MKLSEQEAAWLEVRRYLEANRFDLGVDAQHEYVDHVKFFETPLLTVANWLPLSPIPLLGIDLQLRASQTTAGSSVDYGANLPLSLDNTTYQNYADVFQALAAPRAFQNRTTYRLEEAELTDTSRSRLAFSLGRYFDSLNTGEASAHEYAAARLGRGDGGIRKNIKDPCDLAQRPVNMAVSALTLKRTAGGEFEFFLHWRDPKKVGHAGGLYQVVPSGVFQAAGEEALHQTNDFSLLKFLARELAEELLGEAEINSDGSRALDYSEWGLFRKLQVSVDDGGARMWCVGLGVDPLTFATDLLAVLVFEHDAFADVFGEVTRENDEGRVLAAKRFDEATVSNLVRNERMQAAGAALLASAWHHRDTILSPS
ncbi:hypothetical protein [Amycolatopsis alba]|uniref:Transcriptional regulator n=1 Tax=Amycolatopsis alba DSM 44262 TaxID=1125972 RepID=A0A229R8M0_AMYAL|nr:hypothetical protein [Amycolatopsis alba]OXM42791.1 transcriptional regulator [Amycolatopsis alba DSM 44262]